MKRLLPLWTILIFLSVEPVIGQTGINSIRFGSKGDPLNGLTISWRSEGTADSIVWGNTPDLENGKFIAVKSTSIMGTQFDFTFPTQTAGSTIHYALFDSKDGLWTEKRAYNTASDATDNQFTFSVIGDSRTYPDEWRKIAESVFDTDFTLFLGDIIADGKVKSDWEKWFEYGDKFVSRELVYHTVGNHDDDSSPSGFDNFMGLYTQPGNELYYSFNWGNAVFICINSIDAGDVDQYNWLLSTLEANKDETWKIVITHKPFYTAPSHTGEMDGYFNTWWKAFDDYGVDLIFAGHTHNYQRTVPINRNVNTNAGVDAYGSGEGQGRCQIVAGSAGPLSSAADPSFWWLDNSASLRHFCTVDIDGDELIFKAMGADSVVFDSLVLNKSVSDITFQVDMAEVSDLYDGGAVWLAFGDRDSVFEMSDPDGDNVYTYIMTQAIGTDLNYYFSYQSGADPLLDFNEESVPAECGDAEGYRFLNVTSGNKTLLPILYGSCDPAPQEITFQVDLDRITDLFDGGAVWLAFGAWDSYYEMTDANNDSIYTITVPVPAQTELKYFFSYQNGPDPNSNYMEESAPYECGDNEGYRVLQVPDSAIILPAVLFGSCGIDPGPLPDLSIPITRGEDDAEEYASNVGGEVVGTIYNSSSDLEVTFDSETQFVGLLFRDVQIPPNANVTNAYVQFTVDAVSPGVTDADVDILIYGAKEATVEAITEVPFNISSHPPTTASVTWKPAPSVAEGDATEAEQTSDISAILNEIIALEGWAAGNNVLIVLTGDTYQTANKNREFESYDGDSNSAPVLNVYFNEGAVGVKPVRSELSISIYPNPTEGKFYINNPSAENFSYEIYSINGKLITSRHHIAGPMTEVEMPIVSRGVYFVKVVSAERSETRKLILK